jgi:hypothetical protein
MLSPLFATGGIDTGGKRCRWYRSKLPPVSLTPVVHLDLRREFSKKFETILMVYCGAGGKLIHEKTII